MEYTVGELPFVGYYQLKGSRLFLGGVEHSSHAAMYWHVQKKVGTSRHIGTIQQALSLGYTLKRAGWVGALAGSTNPNYPQPDATALTSFMWAACHGEPKKLFVMRHDGHIIRWIYGRMFVAGTPRVECEIDGWDMEFKVARMRLFFKRMYEEAE